MFMNYSRSTIQRVRWVAGISILALLVACGGPLSGIESVETAEAGRPAYALGLLRGDFSGDRDFLRSAPYLSSKRTVEMYAYVDGTNLESGAEFCENAWTSEPNLKVDETVACAGKRNRRSYVPNREYRAELSVVVGEREFALAEGWTVRSIEKYEVQAGDIVENQRLKYHDGFFFFNQYCIDAPQPECERLRFETIRADPKAEYVVVGAVSADGKSIEAYVDEAGERHFYIAPRAHLAELQ